ncbi:Transcription factor Tfb4 domain containing protein [Russula decolorans]
MSFLPPPSLRHIIAVPRQDKVDFRAACFCHKNIVDIGFVCSICLSSKLHKPVTFNPGVLILGSRSSILFPCARLLDLQVRYCGHCLVASPY